MAGTAVLSTTGYTKNGRVKGEMYETTFERKKINDILKPIIARSAEEAKTKYERNIFIDFGDDGGYAEDTLVNKSSSVNGVSNISATSSSGQGTSSSGMMMKTYSPLKYNFIPSDDILLYNPGFCVPDVFVGTYSKIIKKLTLDYFIKLCYEARGEGQLKSKNHC